MSPSRISWNSKRVQRLAGQLRWVTRITSALSTSIRMEDLRTILVSALISPDGLGYSRALFFSVDRVTLTLQGEILAGPRSRRESLAIRRELKEEEAYLRSVAPSPVESGADEPSRDAFRILLDSKYWISLSQRLELDDMSRNALAAMRSPIYPSPGESKNLLQWAAGLRKPVLVDPAQGAPTLEEPLASLLELPAVAIPFRTPKGLLGLVLADRRYSPKREIETEDVQELEWFALQAGMALENAELIDDLEGAYRQIKEVDTLKSNFLSIISHELRTPMTAILGFVDLLMSERVGELQPNQKAILVRASKNANHLLQILNDLLEVTEVQAEGMRNIQLRPVDPLVVLFNTLPRLDQRRRERHIEVEPVVHETAPRIQCEPRSLERILFHLIDNAIKFSPEGKRVQVEFQVNGDKLDIAVRDAGIGIAPDRVQRIFDSFYQVDNRLTRNYEGLGLGLTVTRMLLMATRGEISVESKLGEGSTFTIRYPLAPPGDTHH